jgi:thioredoxin
MTMSTAASTTSFDELLRTSSLPVFVDFWAEWCGPCKTIAPSIKQLAAEFKGRMIVVKVNVDERPQIAAQYGIQSIPTLMLFKNSTVAWRIAGALPYAQLKQQVEAAL